MILNPKDISDGVSFRARNQWGGYDGERKAQKSQRAQGVVSSQDGGSSLNINTIAQKVEAMNIAHSQQISVQGHPAYQQLDGVSFMSRGGLASQLTPNSNNAAIVSSLTMSLTYYFIHFSDVL